VKGIDAAPVTAWFEDHITGVRPPFSFELIAGGHSNMTYRVVDAVGHDYVLRRPPLDHVLPTAHDMSREHKIIAALGPTAVPVPPALGLCTDPAVNGAAFYVMGYVDGHVLHDAEIAEKVFDEEQRRHAGESFIDVLADLHAVDPDEVGLGDLARKEGYIERQLKRWYSQFQQSKTREVPEVDHVHEFLAARVPAYDKASVVHGDYRLGNCLAASDGTIAAVLDWEICTLGDPMADVGYVMATWPDPTDGTITNSVAPSMVPGFPKRAEMLERYATRSGRDVSLVDYYTAFSMWKSACIVEGVYSRYLGGALGETDVDFDRFKNQVEVMARAAAEAVARLR
jgi:aminoglycoside phosphotransferase (APT) family kinase protein